VLGEEGAELLRTAVGEKRNILIVGGTDSGKTTFANALLDEIRGSSERVVILQDIEELQCNVQDVEYLRTKEGVASLRDLVRLTLRLSPDRIVIGEVRGAEALELLKAWNTGHAGGISTIHANSAELSLSRLEQLIQEAGVTPSREMIAEAIDILVFLEKLHGRRVVRQILKLRQSLDSGRYQLELLYDGPNQ
jgi:type IV secretion system protein VirB11